MALSRRLITTACALLVLGAAPALAQQNQGEELIRKGLPPLELIEFRDVALSDAMRLFSVQTGLNIVPSAQAADRRVSLFLKGIEPLQALKAMCMAYNLWFKVEEGDRIVRIHTAEEYQRDVQSFRDEQIEVFTLLYPNAYNIAIAIADIFGGRVRLSLGGDSTDQTFELQQRLQRFDIFDARSQGLGFGGFNGGNGQNNGFGNNGFGNNGFGNNGGFGGGGGFGGNGFSRNNFGGGNVNNGLGRGNLGGRGFGNLGGRGGFNNNNGNGNQAFDFNQSRIQGLTGEQIQAIEAARLAGGGEVDQSTLDRIIRRTTIFVTLIRRQNRLIVRTGDSGTMKQIKALVARLDVPTPMVLLEVKVMAVQLNDNFSSVFDYQLSDGSSGAGGFTTGDILPPASDAVAGDALRRTQSLALGGSGLNPNNLIFQFVDSHFRARIQLLENENRVTTLATPLLLTANNEVSRLFVGEERPLNRTFQGGQVFVNNGGTQTAAGNTQIEFRPVGTTLLFTPNINADRTVTLRILQENSAINVGGANVLVPSGNGGFIQQAIDTVQSRTISGTVVAKDGLALALGGLIEDNVNDNRAQVPFLGRIPYLGFFFRRQMKGRSRREFIIMIRPYVLTTPKESAEVGRDLLEELSIHPKAPEGRGDLRTFSPGEAIRPTPPANQLRKIFHFHSTAWGDD